MSYVSSCRPEPLLSRLPQRKQLLGLICIIIKYIFKDLLRDAPVASGDHQTHLWCCCALSARVRSSFACHLVFCLERIQSRCGCAFFYYCSIRRILSYFRHRQPSEGGAVNLHSWGLRLSCTPLPLQPLPIITTSLRLQNPKPHYCSVRN